MRSANLPESKDVTQIAKFPPRPTHLPRGECHCGRCDVPYDTVPTHLHGGYSSRKGLRGRQKLDMELGHLSHSSQVGLAGRQLGACSEIFRFE